MSDSNEPNSLEVVKPAQFSFEQHMKNKSPEIY